MTISSTNNRNDYTGNDTTAIYNYSFRVFLESDLTVTVRNTTTDVETELSLTTDYTVQDVGELSGGTITLVDAGQDWISGTSNLDTGYKLTIRRIVGLTQNTDIRNQGDFFPEVHEDAFDRLTMIDQQQQDDLERAIKLPETIASSEFDTTIPADFVGTQSLALVSNSAGDGFATGPSISAIEGAQAAATAAAASASAAATSETNAATSETNAGTSETNAATSETNAATSETNAAASAAAASTSETNAATSETNAANSETNASISANTAITNSLASFASASNAATSEANAATSEANAATSATNAATSETNAATSEANAAASATAAQDAAAASQWKDVVYITNVDSPVSITDADSGKLYSVNTSGGNVVFNLPAISGLTLSSPWSIGVKKTDTSANTVTINPNGTDVIDGNASATISQAETGLVVIPDADPAPDEWTTLVFGEVPSVFEGKTFNDEITMKEITTPSAPSAGFQAIFMDSADSKLKRIDSNGDVFGVGGGAGDADTIHLIRAADQGDTDFTIKSIDDVLPDFGGSDTLTGTFSVPTTGSEALLSNDDDHKVYKYASTTGSQYDAFGVVLDVPRYQRGKDTVLQFKYRTADTSGDSANGDYMVYVFDKTNGVNTTTTSTGSQAAGSTLTVGTTTGMSVGDFILIGQASDGLVKEGYVTEVVSSTTLKVSVDLNLTSGDRFITGALTDSLTLLDAADEDTNKTGTDYKLVFRPPSDCAEVVLMFQQRTSETDSFLYVDNILVSSEVVKRVETQEPAVTVRGASNAGTLITADFTGIDFTQVEDSDNAWDNTNFTAPKTGYYQIEGSIYFTTAAARGIYVYIDGVPSYLVGQSDSTWAVCLISGRVKLEAGEVLTLRSNVEATLSASSSLHWLTIQSVPQKGTSIIVESTDSVKGYFAQATAADTYSVGSEAILNLNADVYDDFSMVDLANDKINILRDGTYTLGVYGFTPVGVSNWAVFGYRINGGGTTYLGSLAPTASTAVNQNNERTIQLSAGDSLQFIIQNGSAVNTTGITVTVEEAVVTADYQPLLAFPTITYGQDAEQALLTAATPAYVAGKDVVYFSSLTTLSNSISNLGTLDNDSTNGLKFTATRRCKVNTTAMIAHASSASKRAYITLNDSGNTATSGKILVNSISHEIYTGGETVVSAHLIMEPGDYINYRTDSATLEANSFLTLLVEPEEGQVNQAAIIAQPVAFVKEITGSGVDAGASSTSWTTRTLNTLEGDIAAVGVTLSSNQFTLPAGKYALEWISPQQGGGAGQSKIYNVTDSVDVKIGGTVYSNSSVNYTMVNSLGYALVTITKATAFDLRHIVGVAKATDGLGISSFFGNDNTFGQVKITRMK